MLCSPLMFVLPILFGVFSADNARAQTPEVTVNPNSGTADEGFDIEVAIRGKKGFELGTPQFDTSEDFTIQSTGSGTTSSYINGVQSFQITFTFHLQPNADTKPGIYQLPPGRIRIASDTLELSRPKFTLLPSREAAGEQETPLPAAFTQVVDNTSPYIGQQIIYRAEIAATQMFAGGEISDYDPQGFFRESLDEHGKQQRVVGDTTIHSFVDVLFPLKTGDLELPPRVLNAKLRVRENNPLRRRRGIFGNPLLGQDDDITSWPFFSGARLVSRALRTKPITVHVRPLPPAPDGAGLYIPVGNLKARFSIEPTELAQGESANMTIKLLGTANLRPYELPKLPAEAAADFKRYDDKADVATNFHDGGMESVKAFKIAYVPQHAGELTTPAMDIVFFDPQRAAYDTLRIPGKTLKVSPAAGEQHLTVKGADAEGSATADLQNKHDITILGEDLLPQHAGTATLIRQRPLGDFAVVAWLLSVPLISLLLRSYLLTLEERRRDPSLALKKNAHKKALAQLGARELSEKGKRQKEKPHPLAETLRAIFIGYLSDRFNVRAESLTAREAGELIFAKTKDDTLRNRTITLLDAVQRALYAGSGSDALDKEIDALFLESSEIIDAVEGKTAA